MVKYIEVIKVTLQNRLAYVYDQAFRSLGMAIHIFIFIQLWRATYAATGGAGTGSQATIGGFTLPQMIWYLVMTETIVISAPRFNTVIDGEVRSGDLAYSLGRPYSYLLFQYARYMGESIFLVPINFTVGALVAWPLVGGIPWRLEAIPAALIAWWLGATILFFELAAVSLMAFWLEDTRGIWLLVDRAQWLLGGLLLPVEAFPGVLRQIAEALPFHKVVGGPARLAVNFNWQEFASLTFNQIIWLIALVGLAMGVYQLGVKRVNVNGG